METQRADVRAGRAIAFQFRANASGDVTLGLLYIDSRSVPSTVTVGVYTNAANHPGTLLGAGSISSPKGGAWNPISIDQGALVSGESYWLAVLGTGGALEYRYRARGCSSETSAQSNLGGLRTSWSRGAAGSNCPASVYLTVTAPVLVPPLTPPVLPPVEEPPAPPAPPLTLAPANILAPEITGAATEGDVLSATEGTWTETPTAYSYQWQDCGTLGMGCVSIEGATGSSYALGSGDVGDTVRVVVTATNPTGSTAAASLASAPVAAMPPPPPPAPVNTALPTVSGTATEGEVLMAGEGSWSGDPSSYSYQWQDCDSSGSSCVNVNAATSTVYTLGGGDVGHTVRVVVTATNAGGSTVAASGATGVVVVPLPLAPVNTAMPAISGADVEGQPVSTTNGTWTGGPTSYSYQWRHCSSSGRSCTNDSGATSSSYTLRSEDVGHTMRVMVRASNAGGSTTMSSPPTAMVTVPPPSPPTLATAPMLSGNADEGETLATTEGTWSGSPTAYSYQWQDCDSSGASCVHIVGATGSSYTLGESDVGHTIRATVTATNAGGSTEASSGQSVLVAKGLVAAPSNSSLPTISGTATEGSALSAAKGTWTGSPTSYAYQWQDCNSSGASCVNVSGATKATYTLVSGDVGHTVRAVVGATNAAGSAQASSAQTATVIANTGQQIDCFSAPGACGYPDPNYANVGPSTACSSLTSSGGLTVNTTGATIQNMNITGKVTIAANNVTLTNDCITVNGKAELGTNAVAITGGKSGTVISYTDISGASATTQSVEEALNNNGGSSNTTADHDYIFNCGECVHGTWKLTNSYVTSNASIPTDHYEDIYCNDTTFIAEHDVLINPHEQTANLFCDTKDGSGGAADDHITLTGSLLAGGGFSVYPQGNASSVGSSTMDISNNRVARCLGAQVSNQGGGTECKSGAESHGYYPLGGQYGVDAYTYCPPTSGQAWSNNVWDDNNETIGC